MSALTLTNILLGVLIAGALIYTIYCAIRDSEPSTYWEDYKRDLEEADKWAACKGSLEGCVWDELCTPGHCKRVLDP